MNLVASTRAQGRGGLPSIESFCTFFLSSTDWWTSLTKQLKGENKKDSDVLGQVEEGPARGHFGPIISFHLSASDYNTNTNN